MSQMNIWIAASDGNIDYVRENISSGKHTANDADPNGYTPMHAAASYGHIDLLKYLVSVGGDVNLKDADGDTPLHAVEDVKTAATLVEEMNANWRLKNEEGQTPLAVAEDDDEYPELIAYFRSLMGSSIIPDTQAVAESSDKTKSDESSSSQQIEPSLIEELYANPSISLSYKNMTDDEMKDDESGLDFDENQRKEIETIINGENAEENLQKYMQKLLVKQLHTQLDNDKDGHSEKKKRTD